jgi:hypothetical protein
MASSWPIVVARNVVSSTTASKAAARNVTSCTTGSKTFLPFAKDDDGPGWWTREETSKSYTFAVKATFDTIDEIVVKIEIRNTSNVLQQLADEPELLKKVIFNGFDGSVVQSAKDEFTLTVAKTVADTAKASRTLQIFFKGVTTSPKASQMNH